MKPIILINVSAGTAAQFAGLDLSDRVARAVAEAGFSADVRQISPQDLSGALMSARQADRPVVMAGGDGSVSAAVQIFAGTGIPLGVIPLGTYNLLGQDLGMMTGDIEVAVRQLAGAREAAIDLGRMRRRYFHTLAGLGFFSRVARQRAHLRERLQSLPGGKILGAAMAALNSFTRGGNLDIMVDDGREKHLFRSPAVLVTNNFFEGSAWRRERLDRGVLELNVARGDVPFPLLKGGLAAVLGSWRESEHIITLAAPQLTLSFRRPRVFLSLDGEVRRTRTPLHFEVVPHALTVLAAPAAAMFSRESEDLGKATQATAGAV